MALERFLPFPLPPLLGVPLIIIGGYVDRRGLRSAKLKWLMTGWLLMTFGWVLVILSGLVLISTFA